FSCVATTCHHDDDLSCAELRLLEGVQVWAGATEGKRFRFPQVQSGGRGPYSPESTFPRRCRRKIAKWPCASSPKSSVWRTLGQRRSAADRLADRGNIVARPRAPRSGSYWAAGVRLALPAGHSAWSSRRRPPGGLGRGG